VDPNIYQALEGRIRQIRFYAQEDYREELRKELLGVVDDYSEVIPVEFRASASARSGEYLRAVREKSTGFGDPEELGELTYKMLAIAESILDAVKERVRPATAPAPPVDDPEKKGVAVPVGGARVAPVPREPDVSVEAPVVVNATDISKRFSSTQFALANMSFELKLGQITALVGRNGSGKSTLLRILLRELAPDTGSVGYPMLVDAGRARHIREHIGYVAQRPERWRGRLCENLEFYAAAFGIRGKANIERVTWLLNRFGLVGFEEHTWSQLSGGYQLRFELARAVLHRPSLLILDEPLANLDVVSQQEFLDDLKRIVRSRASQAAVLVTSQHLFEMEAVADQLILLREGQAAFLGAVDKLGQNRQFNSFELDIKAASQDLQEALGHLKVKSVRRFTTHLQLDFPLEIERAEVLRAIADLRIPAAYVRDISCSTRPLMTGPEISELKS
jgi:ABC-2 type transport system ATP-binding protein